MSIHRCMWLKELFLRSSCRTKSAEDNPPFASLDLPTEIGYLTNFSMVVSLSSIVSVLPSDESWGPATTNDALVDGVPYAPYSKGDKLGRMADWTTEGKDRDGRGGRQQYNRNYRGWLYHRWKIT